MRAPQVNWKKKLMMDGGSAFRLSKKPSSVEESSDRVAFRLPNLLIVNREHSDKPKQNKKRMGKLKWLIMNIPSKGARAKEILMESKK